MRPTYLIIFLTFLISVDSYANFDSGTFFLSQNNITKPLRADLREADFLIALGLNQKYFGKMGKSISLFKVKDENGKEAFNFGITVSAIFILQRSGVVFPLENVDGYFGAYYEFKFDFAVLKTALMHHSAHFSDGTIPFPTTIALFSREYLNLTLIKEWDWLRAYAGYTYDLHLTPRQGRNHFQYGLEIEKTNIGGMFGLFAAAHFTNDQNRLWKLSMSYQTGLLFSSDENRRNDLKLFLGWYHGQHIAGQLSQKDLNYIYGGFGFNI